MRGHAPAPKMYTHTLSSNTHGFHHPSCFVVQRSRGKIADALQLDAVVDDGPENCLDVAVESTAKVILVWHGNLKDVSATRFFIQSVSATIINAAAATAFVAIIAPWLFPRNNGFISYAQSFNALTVV